MCSPGLCLPGPCACRGHVPAGAMCPRRVLAKPSVVCVRRKSKPLCCPVRGPTCAVSRCVPAGTMGARRVLAVPRVVCVRRKSNPLYCPICGPKQILGLCLPGPCAVDVCCQAKGCVPIDVNRNCCASLYVGLYMEFTNVLLPGPCALDVFWLSLGLCAFDVNRPCCTVRYVGLYAVQGCGPAGTMCARRVLAKPSVVYNRCDPRCAALNVDHYLVSRVVFLPEPCVQHVC